MNIKVIRVPGGVNELQMAPGSTVKDALSILGITTSEGEGIQVNGANADLSYTLQDGDRITIAKGAKGN